MSIISIHIPHRKKKILPIEETKFYLHKKKFNCDMAATCNSLEHNSEIIVRLAFSINLTITKNMYEIFC